MLGLGPVGNTRDLPPFDALRSALRRFLSQARDDGADAQEILITLDIRLYAGETTTVVRRHRDQAGTSLPWPISASWKNSIRSICRL
jgi:hypothetical protein